MNRSKYGSKKCKAMGLTFDSQGERDRYFFLCDAVRSGKIKNLQRQIKYPLEVNGQLICIIIPDFVYDLPDGTQIVSDFKGGYKLPPDWPIKAKLLKSIHGIEIHIVRTPTAPLTPEPKKR